MSTEVKKHTKTQTIRAAMYKSRRKGMELTEEEDRLLNEWRENRRTYESVWRQINRERYNRTQREYREKNRERYQYLQRKWRQEHPDYHKEYQKRYRMMKAFECGRIKQMPMGKERKEEILARLPLEVRKLVERMNTKKRKGS